MEEKNDQEKYEQEDLMARGPVSRGASNREAPMYRNKGQRPPEEHDTGDPNSPDYNKMIIERTTGTDEGSSMATDRDLGSVGGGTIPGTGTGPRGGMNTSNSTVGGGGSSAGGVAGRGYTRDRGTMPDIEMDTSTNNANEIDRQAGSNIGGRNPGQPQTSMGDRDHRHSQQGRSTEESAHDPMSSRHPDKVNQEHGRGS